MTSAVDEALLDPITIMKLSSLCSTEGMNLFAFTTGHLRYFDSRNEGSTCFFELNSGSSKGCIIAKKLVDSQHVAHGTTEGQDFFLNGSFD